MTTDEFNKKLFQLNPLGMNANRLKALCGYKSHRSILDMMQGKKSVPSELEEYLNKLYAWHLNNPAPDLLKHRRNPS